MIKKWLKWGIKTALILGRMALVRMKALNSQLLIRYYQFNHPMVEEPVRAVIIGDLHSIQYGDQQTILINQVDEDQPDLIFLVGDITDEVLPLESALTFLEKISANYPVYYEIGNQEHYTQMGEEIKSLVAQYVIQVLDGKTT